MRTFQEACAVLAFSFGAWANSDVPLHPMNRAARHAQSYAPSFALDPATDAVVAAVFFDYQDQSHEAFDVDALVLRDGKIVGKPIPLSRNAKAAIDANRGDDALAAWFSTPAPRIYRQADGRAWLDVLYTAQTPERHGSPHYVIYLRHDLTDALK